MTPTMLRAPFPWFGGKSRAASIVWDAFGDVPNYIEPFAGSLAVLLSRPHAAKIETVNDLDCHLSNFWRAVASAPDDVAAHADWPVNEADLHARHAWLVDQLEPLRVCLRADAHAYDAKIAGWWVWGISQWIGSGWCSIRPGHGDKLPKQKPDTSSRGRGVTAPTALAQKRPVVGNGGRGIHALGRRLPSIGHHGRGTHAFHAPGLLEWMSELSARLRNVRVVCGDWKRVLGKSTIGTVDSIRGMSPTGILLDPPYSDEVRTRNLYSEDDGTLAAKVRAWALKHGDDRRLRIALCGYDGEHEMPASWRCVAWKAAGGYAGDDNENCQRERIWFSPHCLEAKRARQADLFELATGGNG